MKSNLIFVYNANSGLFNSLTDIAHKIFSPETYSCNLCALTHSNFGMRKEWKRFVESLDQRIEFLHSDELKSKYGVEEASLPAIFREENGKAKEWITAEEINSCQTIGALENLILEKTAAAES